MDSFSTVLIIFLAVILMAVVPMMISAGQQDNIAQISVQSIVSEYGNKIVSKGLLTVEDKAAFEQSLGATGNTYDVTIELSILDENPGKKVSDGNTQKIGQNTYYVVYTSQVENYLKDGNIQLKKGDIVKIEVKNTNTTMYQLFKGFIYQTPSNTPVVVGAFTAQVQTTGGTSSAGI